MITTCKCYTRGCKHYLGISQPEGTEEKEFPICSAFVNGIPQDIAYGSNKHNTPKENQGNDIVFEKIIK